MVYRTDDMRRTLAAFGAIANTETGLGTSRDKSTYAEVVSVPLLSQGERLDLVSSSRICRRVVETYPLEAGDGWCEFIFSEARYRSYGFNPDSLMIYFDNFKTGSFRNTIINGSIESRWNGNGYILIGCDDGKNWDEPVDESNIKSIRWTEVLYDFEVTPDAFNSSFSRPEYYRVNRYNSTLPEGERYLRIHRSRIIHLAGDRLSGMALQQSGGRHLSVLQAMYAAYAQCMQALGAASAMLQDYSVFLYKFAGLEDIMSEHRDKIEDGKETSTSYPQAVFDRFLTIQMGMSIIKGIIMDGGSKDKPGESAEFVNRNFGGIDSVLDRLTEQMVASTDLPRSKVLGTANQAGLGAEGRGEQDRYAWAQAVGAWQNRNWREPILYVSRLCLLAKDGVTGGRLPTGYGLNFPSVLQLSDSEKITLRKTHLDGMNVAVAAGFLNPYEVRMSTYGGVKWSYDVALDPDVTKQMKESMFPEETSTSSPPSENTGDTTKQDGISLSELDFDSLEMNEAGEVFYDGAWYMPNEPTVSDRPEYYKMVLGVEDGIAKLVYFGEPRNDALWGVYFQGRTTPTVVEADDRPSAISKARKKGVAGGDGKVVSARKLKGADLKTARAGNWVRTRASGKSPEQSNQKSKFRPQLFK